MYIAASQVKERNLICIEDDSGYMWQFIVEAIGRVPETSELVFYYGNSQSIKVRPNDSVYVSHTGDVRG